MARRPRSPRLPIRSLASFLSALAVRSTIHGPAASASPRSLLETLKLCSAPDPLNQCFPKIPRGPHWVWRSPALCRSCLPTGPQAPHGPSSTSSPTSDGPLSHGLRPSPGSLVPVLSRVSHYLHADTCPVSSFSCYPQGTGLSPVSSLALLSLPWTFYSTSWPQPTSFWAHKSRCANLSLRTVSLPSTLHVHLLRQHLSRTSHHTKFKTARALPLFFFFVGPHPQHMDVSRLGVKLELQLLVYTTATATLGPR